jgi:hypothetical protein
MSIRHRLHTVHQRMGTYLRDTINPHALDMGKADDLLIVAGMGRSGTTWVSDIINYDNRYRVVFEPFSPTRVPEAQAFDFLPYLRPDCDDATLTTQARRILAGQVHNNWVNRDNRGLFYRARIVKEIRGNLMLGWLRRLAHHPPLVLVVRHPLQVAASWVRLGWVSEPDQRLIDLLAAKPTLLQDFPVIRDVWQQIDPADFIECIVFQWCVCHLVPANQLKRDEGYVLYYENLLTHLHQEMVGLFQYLKRPLNQQRLQESVSNPSSTNFLKRDFHQDRPHLLSSWQELFSGDQIARANAMLATFGLDHLYDKNGYPTGAQLLEFVRGHGQNV